MLCAELQLSGEANELPVCESASQCAMFRPLDPQIDPRRLGLNAYWAIFEHSLDAVMFTVPDGRILAANNAACALFGMTEDEIIASGRHGLTDATDDGWAPAVQQRQRDGHIRAELRMRRADGSVFVADLSSVIFETEEGQRACVIVRDITDRLELAQRQSRLISELHQLALVDELTGLRNRRGLGVVAELVLAMGDRSGSQVQVLFIDVDGMKQINDRHGHEAGDHALQQVAAAITDSLRSSDVAARIGGDEFAVLLSNATVADANYVAERFSALLAARNVAGSVPVSASVGIASPERSDTTLESLLALADRRMYEAKSSRPAGGAEPHPRD